QGSVTPPEGPAPGLYALDRAAERDVCRIELSPPTAADKDYAAARLLPGCRDSGITVFDPAGWRFTGHQMTLKARRGHAVTLVALGEGRWRRDPDIGFTLVLRKVEP
uniref:AprI/Inh family metalloprotease inhibitor n=1 Tax=Methylobacterium sp. Leaf118 TaxID=2876562 RepID=UPI001E51A054